jgi:hypothetical protein
MRATRQDSGHWSIPGKQQGARDHCASKAWRAAEKHADRKKARPDINRGKAFSTEQGAQLRNLLHTTHQKVRSHRHRD